MIKIKADLFFNSIPNNKGRNSVIKAIGKGLRMLGHNSDCSKCCGEDENAWWYKKCKDHYCTKNQADCTD